MNTLEFNNWKSSQLCNMRLEHLHKSGWSQKYYNKRVDARNLNINFSLTKDEYLYLAFKANLNHPSQIGCTVDDFQLARFNDLGGYEISNCRFITKQANEDEKNSHYDYSHKKGENHHNAKLSSEQVIKIYLDPRSVEEIGSDYLLSNSYVNRIKCGDRWSSVTKDLIR